MLIVGSCDFVVLVDRIEDNVRREREQKEEGEEKKISSTLLRGTGVSTGGGSGSTGTVGSLGSQHLICH